MIKRPTIKTDSQEDEWESGAYLKKDERFQTDGEWHAGILKEIDDHICQANQWLENIYDKSEQIPELLESQNRNLKELYSLLDKKLDKLPSYQPMKTWRFLTIILVILTAIFALNY